MTQHARKRPGLAGTLITWLVTAALLGWGVWQMAAFRQTLLADAQHGAAPSHADPVMPASETLVDIEPVAQDTAVEDPEMRVVSDLAIPTDTPATAAATAPAELRQRAGELITSGERHLAAGRIVQGREALNGALAILGGADPRGPELRRQLAALNVGVFLGGDLLAEDPLARYVEIAAGDSFLKIGRRFAIPAALVGALNPGLNPRNLKPGAGLKVVTGPFHVRVVKAEERLDLYARDMYVRSFAIRLEEGNYLPRGVYRVKAEQKIQVGAKLWIGFEGAEPATASVDTGWLHGAAGPRRSASSHAEATSGIKLADADLAQLYNTLVETRSLVRVDP
jgi:hypothetical protein